MLESLRPYVTTGIALVGAGAIALAPVTPPQPAAPVVQAVAPTGAEVRLAAASFSNVPANLIKAILNSPTAAIAGVERFAAAMAASGSWNESHPNNVWGWDDVNPEHAKALVDILLLVPSLSTPLGEHVNWYLAANLPMHEGCAFECPDPEEMLGGMFRVPAWEFWDADGYTFPEVINPVSGLPTAWSGQTVTVNPWEPVTAFVDYLMEDPGHVEFPTAYETITALANLAAALQTTEHLAPWIPVREIETFLKMFVPAPEASVETARGVESNARAKTFDGESERGTTTSAPDASESFDRSLPGPENAVGTGQSPAAHDGGPRIDPAAALDDARHEVPEPAIWKPTSGVERSSGRDIEVESGPRAYREAGDDAGDSNARPDGTDSADTDSADTDLADTDLADTDSADTDSADTDSAGTDSAGTDSAGTDSAGTDSAGTQT
ncbi:MAG: hypothetical protein AB7G47_04145 [Mycolicibacterium sp.]|uniref:hypothetical protein n=1 Tax=Mycolicibacterium sp. TaxID=2320850 RepID=UPI003D122017